MKVTKYYEVNHNSNWGFLKLTISLFWLCLLSQPNSTVYSLSIWLLLSQKVRHTVAYLLIVPSSNAAHDWPNDKQVCTWVGNLRGQHRLFRHFHTYHPSSFILSQLYLRQDLLEGANTSRGSLKEWWKNWEESFNLAFTHKRKGAANVGTENFLKYWLEVAGFIKIILISLSLLTERCCWTASHWTVL